MSDRIPISGDSLIILPVTGATGIAKNGNYIIRANNTNSYSSDTISGTNIVEINNRLVNRFKPYRRG